MKNEELSRINDELLKRRADAKADALEKYKDKLAELKEYLAKGQYELSRELAEDLRGTAVFDEVIKAFHDKPELFYCEKCGKNIKALIFNKQSLKWVRSHLCDDCDQREKKKEIEKQKKVSENFIERNMVAILKSVGVEGLLLNASFKGFPSSVIQTCKRAVTAKHGLYIYGGVGRGKSWLSVAVLKELIKMQEIPKLISSQIASDVIRKFQVQYRFVYVPWLLMEIKATYDNSSSMTEQGIIEKYTKIPVLILDDIGSERPTEWVDEKLNMIIYFRNNRGLKTIYTSNVNPDGLQERLNERITSRILQQCEIICLTGPDRRR